jgi:tRNA (guanine37-N1)-methyltransferase
LLRKVNHARSVYCQTSKIDGDYRLRRLEYLAGVENTIAHYRENGCTFKVDVANAYFSPRLSTERKRIALLIKDNETIANLFGGVGTFSIIIARFNKTARVFSVDSNLVAHNLCQENCIINRVTERVVPLFGDATQITRNHLMDKCDRVLMPLPERAMDFVDDAISCLVNGKGIVHYFSHVRAHDKRDALEKAAGDASRAFKGYKHAVKLSRVVREVGPRYYQLVSDVHTNE